MIEKLKSFLSKDFTLREGILTYIILLGLYILPLITSNLHYRDDYVRVLRGNDWDILGRRFTDFTMYFLSINFNAILNISPLNYILSILILSLTMAHFIQKVEIRKSLFSHIALSFIILSPFYLQNLSYQYDSFPMSFSVCLILLAYTQNWHTVKGFIIALALIAGAASFFQPATNIYPVLIIGGFLLSLKDNNTSNKIKTLFLGAITYLSGLIVYFVWLKFINSVAQTDRSKLIDLNVDSISTQLHLVIDLFKIVSSSLIYSPLFLLFTIGLLLFIIHISILIYTIKGVVSKALVAASPFAMVFFIWGPFILLEEAFSEARVFMSLGAIMSIIGFSMIKFLDRKIVFKGIFFSLVVLNCLSMMYIYVNLAKEDDAFNDQLATSVAYDINSRPELFDLKSVYINSYPPRTPNSKIVLNNIPFLEYINTPFNVWISRYVIESKGVHHIYKDINNMDDKYDWEAICQNKTAKRVVNNKYYEIYTIKNDNLINKTHVSVWFKRRDSLCDDPPNLVFKKYYIKLAY